MKRLNLSVRMLALILCFAMVLQSGFVMPAFAEDTFSYRLNYNETQDGKISETSSIIIPDEAINPEYGAEAHSSYGTFNNNISPEIGTAIGDWGPEPYRIIGYTFDGWYTDYDRVGTKVEKSTVITADMVDDMSWVNLYGNWIRYGSPDINTGTVSFDKRNGNDEDITDVIEWTDNGGNPITFTSDVTDYYAYVYGNMASVRMSFEQYEPDGTTEITVNGNPVNKTSEEYITGTGYWYENQGDTQGDKLVAHTVNTGKSIVTDYMPLEYTSDSKVYNEIKATVTLPNGNSKTYTFHIKRLTKELKAAYGNTPYGRIMSDDTLSSEQFAAAKAAFDSSLSYRNGNYNAKAWNIYGDAGVEVKKGTAISGTQYINYDKDETAIVVFSGDSFTDPGVKLYDSGSVVNPTAANPIKRTITYQTIPSLKYGDWGNTTDKVDEKDLTGADGENVIDILKNNYVKPGIYSIDYEYTPAGERSLYAHKAMIVLPKEQQKNPYQYDLNMDNYINALDVLMYDMLIADDSSIGENIYKYRAMDVSPNGRNDGVVDNTDKEYVINKRSILSLYPSYSVEEPVSQHSYTVPTVADGNKAQLYMDFLGKDGSVIADATSVAAPDVLQKNDTFYIGYRFANTSNLAAGDLKEITIAVNYDSRYINPTATTTTALLNYIKQYNSNLAVYNIVATLGGEYIVDSSTAAKTWNTENNTSQVKTLKIEMHLKNDANLEFSDGYILKLPFNVTTVPTNDGRCVISTQLGANTLNMAVGGNEYMWDTTDRLNSVTTNLMPYMQYMGDYVPSFTDEAAPIELVDAEYGKDVAYSGFATKGIVEGTVPNGLTYTPATGTIAGTPTKSGVYIFYVNGIKYSITVKKAELRVIADDKEKIYGSANPTLTLHYDESYLKNGDNIAKAVNTDPTVKCDADNTTQCQDNYPIVFDELSGDSDDYYFTFTNGNLKITQKEIEIKDVRVPSCSVNATFPYTFTATAKGNVAGDFTAEGIINGDLITILYDVTYPTGGIGTGKAVNISNIRISPTAIGYEAGKNYKLKNTTLTSNKGEVKAVQVVDYSINTDCQLEYTYGTPLNLNTGSIHVKFDNGEEVDVTFEQAKSNGFVIQYNKSGKPEAKNGDQLHVSETGTSILVTGPNDTGFQWTNPLKINKKDLHIKADNKVRYYGEDNTYVHTQNESTTGFTYSLTTPSEVVTSYGDTDASVADFSKLIYTCTATESTEVDKSLGYTNVDIDLSYEGDSISADYNVLCSKGMLTINKRPLTIQKITAGVPCLTADYYMNSDGTFKTAPYNVSASAIAGAVEEGSSASMEVVNLYNNDPVRITYNAQYANYNAAESVGITVDSAAMDDDYGKSYNYTVASDSTTTADGGRVYVKNITAMEVLEEPTLGYTYGTPLNLNTGKIKLTYDSGEVYICNFEEIKSHPVDVQYDGTTDTVVNDTHIIVADTGKKITLTPKTIYEVDSYTTNELTVTPHKLRVAANDVYTTYGETIDEYSAGYKYTYTASDFQYDDDESNITGYTNPTLVCVEDNGVTAVNQKTYAGVYTIRISDAAADNYTFEYTNGDLTIRQRPLVVSGINNIWTVSSKDARDKKLTKDFVIDTSSDNTTLTFAENCGPLWDDYVRISYTASYTEAEAATQQDIDNAVVNITNAVLDRSYGNSRNYYLQAIKTPQTGEIEGAKITDIEITVDPTKNADGTVKEYSYGDTLDLSGGRYKVTYDSGRVDSDITLDSLADYGITATYTDTSDAVEDGKFVTIDYYNGKSITLTPTTNFTTAVPVTTGSIKVNKRKMHVIVNDASYTYGDGPASDTYTLTYEPNDFAPGESILNGLGSPLDGFTAPVLSCKVNGAEPDGTTGAGTYTNSITASGGTSHNYEFVCDDEDYEGTYGTLTINKRDLKIKAITGGIPTLTSKDVYDNNYELPIKLDGEASNSQLTIENLRNNDEIKVVYKAVYNSLEQSDSESVGIEDVDFASDCDSKNNYKLVEVPADSTGKILTRLMSKIIVNSNPDKMEYTYGEWFRLSGGSVDIVYNSGYIEEDVTFDNLKNFDVDINFVNTDESNNEVVIGEVKPNALLTVSEHNGAKIKLTPSASAQVTDDIQPAYSGEITVHKHVMRVVAEDKSITYGDSAPDEYTWHYQLSDLVNGDSLESGRFKDDKTDPSADCEVDGNPVDTTTIVGEYVIVPSGGSNKNYELEYVNGKLTVDKKELRIKSINSGIPTLTSEIIYHNGGVAPVTISNNAAENADMTLEGIINSDDVGITYSAIYNSIDANEAVEIGIADVVFDTLHVDNDNYKIVEAPSTATGGAILEEQVIDVKITADPVLRDDNNQPIQYTYGDPINLKRGAVTVKYDSGREITNVKFNQLASITEGKVKLVYTDADETPAADGDILHVSKHNGKSIKLKVTSEATVTEPKTAAIVVNKSVITVTARDDERYYGDENPVLKFDYSGFVNGDDENSPNFRLDLVEPKISCDAVVKSPINDYEIKLSGGSSANYSFSLVNATLTVKKRPLDIEEITNGIPVLTSKIIHDNPQLVHKLSGTAINTAGQVNLGNLSYGDAVKLTYNVTYTSITEAHNILINISDFELDDSYGESNNYVIRNKPATTMGGNIYEKQIIAVEVTNQPKLEYVYGETLDLSGKGVRILYDDGSIVSNVAFDELADYNIAITCIDNEGNVTAARTGDKLTVPLHNGAIMTLTPTTTLPNVHSVNTRPIVVSKKPLTVNIASISSVYGEDPKVKFAYDYNAGDFEYGETKESPEFADNLTNPTFICLEKDGTTTVSETSNVGSYTIAMTGAQSDNYRFVYDNGTLTITKRKIVINNITSGIPELTSEIIFNNPGEIHKLDASADNNSLEYSNLVNNDRIRILYKAVYYSEAANTTCDIGVEYVSMDNSYDRSGNYEIDTENSVRTITDGGKIHDKEITAIEITEQPYLEYTYGEKLSLKKMGGKVKIVYDSGFEEEVTFADLLNHRVTLTYTDDSSSGARNAGDGDVLTVPDHNGKKLTLNARSTHSVESKSTDDVIKVKKRILQYGSCPVNSIVYDGATTATTGTVVFINAQYNDKVTANGTFNFEDFNAGENKIVYVTDVKLNSPFTDNYELVSNETTSYGTIEKATATPSLAAEAVALPDTTNIITITPPEMTEVQINGGAKYEYSIDGGATWQDSNVFENLELGQNCSVCIRFAQTDNYNQSDATAPISVTTYKNKLTLISKDTPPEGEDHKVLASFYTNVEGVEKEENFKELIGETEAVYYTLYKDIEGKETVKFPLEISGDMTVYTTLKKPSSGGGGSKSTPKPVATATPTPTETPTPTSLPSPTPTVTILPTITPEPGNSKEPYLNGYDNMIKPDDNMTRAEAATIMVNLKGDTGEEYENIFSDVRSDTWYERYISQASERGLISGFEDGSFRPEDTITREQFATMIVRMAELDLVEGKNFEDVAEDRWSSGFINAAAENGIISKNESTFRPEDPIKRSEAVRMINVATGRNPDKDAIDKVICPYTDLPKSHWAYYEFMIASYKF